jgi:septal ring factor EnvC (AmiA/AmiB activator)
MAHEFMQSEQPQQPDHFGRRSIDLVSVELRGMFTNVNDKLGSIQEDIKKIDQHERDILNLQHKQEAQQTSIDALSKSIDKLTATVGTIGQNITDLSMKFFTGVAWVGGGAAVISLVWVLLSSGVLKFNAGG